ncbi:MAG: selenoneine biosynthesis selenosugar synthase SenB [Burkholderiales bacterium]|nr:selenoneine biosynthesis selenosugar synthase SenB [Burkholderiales bacterium]
MNRSIVIITPALADANNGNWQTASRWGRFLRAAGHRVRLQREWDGQAAGLMIALHARRSADSIARFAATGAPVAVVLTGTDLYRDIQQDPDAIRSLTLASRLVLLQSEGRSALPADVRERACVIHQSARTLTPRAPRVRHFDLVMVGHVRPEKDPLTALRALGLLDPTDPVRQRLRLLHIGGDRDPALYRAMADLAARDGRLRLLGALTHAQARRQIARARALILPSLMEGGANVLIEAVTSGVPVLASRIDGSIGMLGADYPGFFPVGDAAALADLIARLQDDPAFGAQLLARCQARAALFEPARERAAVQALAEEGLAGAL